MEAIGFWEVKTSSDDLHGVKNVMMILDQKLTVSHQKGKMVKWKKLKKVNEANKEKCVD